MTETEKRRSPRQRFSGPLRVNYGFVEALGLRPRPDEANGVDICAGGLGILSDVPLEKGTVVRLTLSAGGDEPVIPVLSEVVWTNPVAERFRIGLRFLA